MKGLETRDPRGAAEPSEAACECAAPSVTRRACVQASSRIAALPLPAGIRAAVMIFVLTHYIIIRISFARDLPDAGATAEMHSSP